MYYGVLPVMVKPTIAEVFSSYSVVNVDPAETTLAHKKRAPALFCAFLAEGGRPVTVWDVTRDDVAEWRAWLMHAKGLDGQARFKVTELRPGVCRCVAPGIEHCTPCKRASQAGVANSKDKQAEHSPLSGAGQA
ncbi:MAG: hypothetical protein V2B18_25425 [Pseudomonadota bacterium]